MKLSMGGLLLGILLASPVASPAIAGQLRLEMSGGRVTLVAEDVTVGQILDEWARVGQTQVINGDSLPDSPVTLQLASVPEKLALDVILRSTNGYIAAPRRSQNPGSSFYDRILVFKPNTVAPLPQRLATALPTGQAESPVGAFSAVRPDSRAMEETYEEVAQEEEDGAQTLPPPFQASEPARGVPPRATNPAEVPAGTSRVPGMVAPASGSPFVPMPD